MNKQMKGEVMKEKKVVKEEKSAQMIKEKK